MNVALVHDYLTQCGGAERVVLSMRRAFPDATIYTSLYDPVATFPEFGAAEIEVQRLNRWAVLRRHHRLALPLLASSFARCHVAADVVLCSSSGWAHGVRTDGAKIVYCYTPARWLYQADRYFGAEGKRLSRAALGVLRPYLESWDRKAAASAQRYLTSSRAVALRISATYGIEATVVPPPHTLGAEGVQEPVDHLDDGFALCVSRLLPYKNLDTLIDAFRNCSERRLVIVGDGPERGRLARWAPGNVTFVGKCRDAQLRWLYARASMVLCPSYEDYGLTPLEAASFGKPVGALRWGGFLDTVVEGCTGVFFESPSPAEILNAVLVLGSSKFDECSIRAHALQFDEASFVAQLRNIVSTL